MDRTVDLDGLALQLGDRVVDWSVDGFRVGPLTWRDAEAAWPQPIVGDRSSMADPESLGVTIRLSKMRHAAVVFWRGGWADVEMSLDNQIVLAAPEIESVEACTALIDDLARRLVRGDQTLAVDETMLLDADRTLRRSAGGGIRIDHRGNADSHRMLIDPELPDPDDLCVALLGGWLLAVGDHSHTVLSWSATDPELRPWGPISRLDLAGYDPGGLDRVAFWPVDDARCLVETETGFCLVHREQGLIWEVVHDDPTCRVQSVTDRLVITTSDGGPGVHDVAEGRPVG